MNINIKTLTFFKNTISNTNFFAKNNFFCIKKLPTINKNKFLFCKYSNNKLYFFIEIIKKYNFFILHNLYINFKLNYGELELKGLNYRFSKFWSNLILDLGQSHFQVFSHPLEYALIFLWKKKLKRILIINFNNQIFSSLINFFWYNLKSVGPYKLKGFQFINEWLKLKQGKKPFK